MDNLFISCKESRIENNRSFYGCFYLGPFDSAQSLTIANALRRTLLSECPGLGIISVTIENVSHEYSTLPGMRESVLDLLLNLKEIVFSPKDTSTFTKPTQVSASLLKSQSLISTPFGGGLEGSKTVCKSDFEFIDLNASEGALAATQSHFGGGVNSQRGVRNDLNFKHKPIGTRKSKKPLVGYLKVKGPGVIRAKDMKLPPSIQCVDPDQYIATLAEDCLLCMKFLIMEGKGYMIQKKESLLDKNLVKKREAFLNEIQQFSFSTLSLSNSSSVQNLTPVRAPGEATSKGVLKKGEQLLGKKEEQTFTPFMLAKEEKREIQQKPHSGFYSKPLNLDCIFNPVTKVNYIIEDFDNKITKDFNDNSNLINHISSLIESSHYLNQKMPLAPNLLENRLSSNFQSEIILNGKAVSNFVESFTKDELEQLSNYLHPLKKPNTLHNVILEIWTNGSLHPRDALLIGFENLGSQFLNLAANV